jgi:hypothetical protein
VAKGCKEVCTLCKGGHHKLFCGKSKNNQVSKPGTEEEEQKTNPNNPDKNVSCISMDTRKKAVLLQTAKVKVEGPQGKKEINVLFDSGSDKTYISKEIVNCLQLKPVAFVNHKYTVFGGGKSSTCKRKVVKINMIGSKQNYEVQCMEIPVICAPLSKPKIPEEVFGKCGVQLAGEYTTEGDIKIDMLIGLDNYWKLMSNRFIRIQDENLVAQESVFGFILSGQIVGNDRKNISSQLLVLNDLSEAEIRRFWDLEHIGIKTEETQ